MCFGKRKIPRELILDDHTRTHSKFGVGWIAFAIGIVLGSMIFSMAANASETAYETQAGQLMFQNDKGLYEASLHLNSHSDVKLSGMMAQVTLTQSFRNHTDDWQEGVYLFPLPENAAVNHMEMRIGERKIVGKIKEKQHARNIYQQAKKSGKHAALTEQQRPNLFTQRVANIPPKEEIEISITYIHSVHYAAGEFSWRMPMTITPRFFPKTHNTTATQDSDELKKNSIFSESFPPDEPNEPSGSFTPPTQLTFGAHGWATSVDESTDAWPLPATFNNFHSLDIQNPMTISIELASGLPLANIEAPYHRIKISKDTNRHRIELANKHTNMDRDFVLQWQPVASESPQAAIFSEEIDGDYYALLMVVPPQHNNENKTLARDMVFIIDTSSSMGGTSIEQAKRGLGQALLKLRPQDRFNIIEFNSHTAQLFNQLDYATPYNVQQAQQWVKNLQARGGTNMLPALNDAFAQYKESSALQQTVFITDGAVGNETQLFNTIHKKLGDSRLFTVGIGSAPNAYFMKKAAKFGRGTYTFIGDVNHVADKINTLFTKLNGAIAKNVHVQWPGNAHIYPNHIPDLYKDEPLLISAKSKDMLGDIEISGTTAKQTWVQHIALAHEKNHSGIASLWARAKIEDLEDMKHRGGNIDVIKQEITDVALRHRLLSAYTSFVAVEEKVSRRKTDTLASTPLLNSMPAGHGSRQHLRSVNYPSTATSAEISWWLGLFLTIAWIVLRRLSKD